MNVGLFCVALRGTIAVLSIALSGAPGYAGTPPRPGIGGSAQVAAGATVGTEVALNGPHSLSVETLSGSVHVIETGPGSALTLTARNRSGSVAMVNHEQVGPGRLRVWVEEFDSVGARRGGIDLEIRIPRLLLNDLTVTSHRGDIFVDGEFSEARTSAFREIRLEAAGSIECTGVCALGRLVLRSSDGNIATERTIGSIEATTGRGAIRIAGSHGSALVRSLEGDITGLDNFGNFDAKTSSGTVRITNQSEGDVRASTDRGDVELSNPDAFSEKADSGDGRVRFGFKINRTAGALRAARAAKSDLGAGERIDFKDVVRRAKE